MKRPVRAIDVKQIQELEESYYDGYFISEAVLSSWIKDGNFFVIEENSKIVGSIYFEFLNEIRDLPWEHQPINNKTGKYIYISEIAVDSIERIDGLFTEVLKAAKGAKCKAILWLTGEKSKHDKFEKEFLAKNNFRNPQKVEKWECSPGYFIHDHSIWIKEFT